MVKRKKIDPLNVKPAAQKIIMRLVFGILTFAVILSMYSSCAVTAILMSKKKSTDPISLITVSSQVTQVSKNYLLAALAARTDSDPMNIRSVVDGRALPDLPGENQSGFTVTDVYLRSQSVKSTTLRIANSRSLAREWVSVFGAKIASANDDKGQVRFFIVRCLQVGSTLTILSLPSPTPSDPLKKLVLDPVYSKPLPDQSALSVAMKNFVTNYFLTGTDGSHTDLWRVYVSKKFDTSISAPSYFTSISVISILSTKTFFDLDSKVGQKNRLQINLQGFNSDDTFSIFSVFVTAVLSSDNQWLVDSIDNFIALQ